MHDRGSGTEGKQTRTTENIGEELINNYIQGKPGTSKGIGEPFINNTQYVKVCFYQICWLSSIDLPQAINHVSLYFILSHFILS